MSTNIKGIKHKDVGGELAYDEFHAEDAHELASGTSFPASPSEGDIFYRTDKHSWYQYNGSSWRLIGSEIAEQTFVSDLLKHSNDAEVTVTETVYTLKKEITIPKAVSKARIRFDIRTANGATYYFGKIYKNGSPIGTERTGNQTTYQTYSEDFSTLLAEGGDKIQLYAKRSNTSYNVYVQNFRIYYTYVWTGTLLREEHGYGNVDHATSGWASISVTFAVAFSIAPKIMLGLEYNTYAESAAAGSITTTGFLLYTKANYDRTVAASWLALGSA